jgi:hypothetical protein
MSNVMIADKLDIHRKSVVLCLKKYAISGVESADEKPGIQAIGNVAEDLPPTMENGFIGRDSEYKRDGTVSLLAGMDLITAEMIPLVREAQISLISCCFSIKNTLKTSGLELSWIIMAHIPPGETRGYLEQHPGRFEIVFKPKHGSWLNMLESIFSKFSRVCLHGIRVNSKEELSKRIYECFDEINKQPVTYRWKNEMDELVV